MKTIKLYQSEGDSPRDWDNLSIIASKNFQGDETIADPIDWLTDKLGWSESYVSRIASNLDADYYSDEVRVFLEQEFFSKFVALPLYKYEHSGIALATTPFQCRWDSGQIGYIYTTKEKMRENWSIKRITEQKRQQAFKILESELEVFGQYISGEVYGFDIEDEDGNSVDSCGGFYGDDWANNGMLEHIDYKEYGWTKEETIEKLKETKIDY